MPALSSDSDSTAEERNLWSALKSAVRRLEAAGVESPRLTAELLLARVLDWDRPRILAHLRAPLAPEAREKFLLLVARRASGEPLHYILGEREFFGLPFRVTPGVLIPRPETELLVEKAIEAARSRARGGEVRFADIGTGSGCIAISLAYHCPGSLGWAVDISARALEVAQDNALRHGVSGRIQFVRGDLLSGFRPEPVFDLILSNPPYVAIGDPELAASVHDFEPHEALFGGERGLSVYRRLIPEIPCRLRPGAIVLMEIGAGQAAEVGSLVEETGLRIEEVLRDLQGIPRCIVAGSG